MEAQGPLSSRKNFMKRKPLNFHSLIWLSSTFALQILIKILATFEDPLRRREEFAVSLRKKKNMEIISAKRKKLFQSISAQ